jgi:type IV pilus assembly protein PilM
LSSADGVRQGIYRSGFVRKIARVLDAMPHPVVACEISPTQVAAARWHGARLDKYAVEAFPAEALRPSPVESNLVDAAAVRSTVERVMNQIGAKDEMVALFLPDSVVRVFVLHFEVFPRTSAEAIPMLRWRLKKSVPFEAEETLISYMRQAPRDDGVDIVTGLARLRIVKEYESLVEALGLQPGVVMSSTLAALPLLDDHGPTMLARISGAMLTTAIAREGILCGYRCTELPSSIDTLAPRALLEEIFPVAAYYQDAWSEGLQAVQLAGFGSRVGEFQSAISAELQCPVSSLLRTAESSGRITGDTQDMARQELDALIGWSMNRGA